jgi:type II secretory pathway pseudopilin PulG
MVVAVLRREAGFTYVGLIVLVTIIGLVGAATLKADTLLRRAAAEQELLEIGAAFSAALTSYAEATPRGQLPQPPSLEALLKDPRFPGTRRHLRKIFVDPVTGKAEWGIVWLNKGTGIDGSGGSGVLAVYSLSEAKPLKQANFDGRFQNFENRDHLSEWKFAVMGQGVVQSRAGHPGQSNVLPGQPGQPGQKPGESQPSLFPARANPANPAPSPAEPLVRPEPAPEPQAPPSSEASGSGEDDKGNRPEQDERDEQDRGKRG